MNRYTQLTPASFNPLSMEEILAVPLAKQQRHDQLMMAAAEEGNFANQYLDTDESIVLQGIDQLKGGLNSIEDELSTKGINSGLVRKMIQLKRDKQAFLSPTGVGGQAQSAYDSYQANVQTILKNNNASQEDKMRQIAAAKAMYDMTGGVANKQQYTPYYGYDTIDINKKLIEYGSKIKPIIEKNFGWTKDEASGMWWKNGQSVKSLPDDVIITALMQAAGSDQEILQYLQSRSAIDPSFDARGTLMNSIMGVTPLFRQSEYEKIQDFKYMPEWARNESMAQGQIYDNLLAISQGLPAQFDPEVIKNASAAEDLVLEGGQGWQNLWMPIVKKRGKANPEKVISTLWSSRDDIRKLPGVYVPNLNITGGSGLAGGWVPNPFASPEDSSAKSWWKQNMGLDLNNPAHNKIAMDILTEKIAVGNMGVSYTPTPVDAKQYKEAERRMNSILLDPTTHFIANGKFKKGTKQALEAAGLDASTTTFRPIGRANWNNALYSVLPKGAEQWRKDFVTPHMIGASDKKGNSTILFAQGYDSDVSDLYSALNETMGNLMENIGRKDPVIIPIVRGVSGKSAQIYDEKARYLSRAMYLEELGDVSKMSPEQRAMHARNLDQIGAGGIIKIEDEDGVDYLTPQDLEQNWSQIYNQ